jgi:L-fucono-1,5-lactonase
MGEFGGLRVDAHLHVWDLGVRPQPWTLGMPELSRSFSLADVQPALAANHFDATVLVQTVTVPDETPELLALAAREPLVAGVVGWTDLTDPDVGTRLAAVAAGAGGTSLVGIRHQVQAEPDPRWLCRRDVRRGLAAVADNDLAFDLVVRPLQLPAAAETAAELPQLRFVLDHGGKPDIAAGGLEPWASDIADLSLMPNVAVKLSGLVTEADHDAWTVEQLRPYVDVLLEAFGPDRVMFGSDWPVCLLATSYDVWVAAATALTAGLTEAERREIFGSTAARWYRLTT